MIKQIRQGLNVISVLFTAAEDAAESLASGTRVLRAYADDWEDQEKNKMAQEKAKRDQALAQLQVVDQAS
ncbi:hypothetical protein IT774_07595 [Salinimonas marina]|uniref:Uncharacterized protein n=1 Tax=Salinimonas marina TaxID=2785918 RepID=A0A7S9DZS9_9ALTE|nr:hypothetical protein [Salinimonas marina]QPG06958.1 hypothetical protein IT774_07595 [Salinimonas marina]